ncbi:MAG: hypothetical protein AABZ47_13540, partial [Planctomycetota bacterium]
YGRVTIDPALADHRLEDRFNQIGLPLIAVARTDDDRERIVSALLAQQGNVAANRAESLTGEVYEVVAALAQPGDEIRPGDVANEINRRRAAASGVSVDKLKHALTPERVSKVLARELELPRLIRDSRGSRFQVNPDRWDQLKRRFGDTPAKHTQPSLHTPSPEETAILTTKTAFSVGCVSSVSSQGGTPTDIDIHHNLHDQDPTTDESDRLERESIMSVEADAERDAMQKQNGRDKNDEVCPNRVRV